MINMKYRNNITRSVLQEIFLIILPPKVDMAFSELFKVTNRIEL